MSHYSGITFQGEPRLTLGGVGRNLATAIELLGHKPIFITSLAHDNLGQFARAEMRKLLGEQPMEARFKILEWSQPERGQAVASSCFALVLIDSLTGQCEYVIANLEAKRAIIKENLSDLDANLKRAHTPLVILDANLSANTLDYLLGLCHERRVPIFLEPTDVACLNSLVATVVRIKQNESERRKLDSLAFLSPNVIELYELVRLFWQTDRLDNSENAISQSKLLSLGQIEALARELMSEHLPNLACLLVTMDRRGVLVVIRNNLQITQGLLSQLEQSNVAKQYVHTLTSDLVLKYYPPCEVIESPVSGSGAGDCFASGFISGLLSGANLDQCTMLGLKASLYALRDESTVPNNLREMSKCVVAKLY